MSLRKVSLKGEWVLTQAAFDGLLAMLDSDRDKAGEKYEFIRLKLLKYFQWWFVLAVRYLGNKTSTVLAGAIFAGRA